MKNEVCKYVESGYCFLVNSTASLEFIVGLVEDVCVRLIESSTTSINKIEDMIEVLVGNF
jgi:hypothetical protein